MQPLILFLIISLYSFLRLRTKRFQSTTALVFCCFLLVFAVFVYGLDFLQLGIVFTTRSVALGLALSAATGVAVLILYKFFKVRFKDSRISDLTKEGLVDKVFWRIPIHTVLPEELLFRGLLQALFAIYWPSATVILASAAAFSLWHILPSLEFRKSNSSSMSTGIAIAVNLAATFFAGLAFSYLRFWSGSLIAPILLHWSINGFGAWASWRASQATEDRK